MIAARKPDTVTKRWMRDASDELAVSKGCWFDEERGQFVVDWLYDYLRLYEGEAAGQPFECVDWQYDATMRLFGWSMESEDWSRVIRRFNKASIWVAKKNKKSPTLAAWTTYMCCGDGVMGQKCFPTAKNGNQIKQNVGRHIFEMIRQSDMLSSECTLNKVSCSVFHEPTRSLIMPLSSENVQTQKATEGLNGSIFVDEVHVVDKAHMDRISRAGISRPEPLHIEVSTAGDEPESYGKKRHDYAIGVIKGVHKDIKTLCLDHSAPQDISDEDIHEDPIKFGRMANPAWGHTVKQGEFLEDYNTSKKSLSEFSLFKKYRLNIWQQSNNPWIDINKWRACPSTPSPLEPSALTYGGLDLSRITDFTAWVLIQPGEVMKTWGHYWCPRQRGIELSSQFEIPVLDWEQQGWVTLTEDSPIPRRVVHNRIQADCERYKHLKYVGYDRALMSDTIEWMQEEIGIEAVEVAQGTMSLNAPCLKLEELVEAKLIDFSGDPVLDWMIQNTAVKEDNNGGKKPVKTDGGVRKHIDGIVSLVMAILLDLTNTPKQPSIYETPGMLTL